MAQDVRISELNEIIVNSDINEVIVNNKETTGDVGVTKKIQVSNFLTSGIVKTDNIADDAVATDKLDDLAVTADKIANSTITNAQILSQTINNNNLGSNSVDNRVLNNETNFTAQEFNAVNSITSPVVNATSILNVPTGNVNLNNINYTFPTQETPQYFLRTDGAGKLTWEEAVPGDGTTLVFSEISPVGTIVPWGGSTSVPAGGKWLSLTRPGPAGSRGARFDGTVYPDLATVLGTTYGPRYTTETGSVESPTGNWYTLPNMYARLPIGEGTVTETTADWSRTTTLDKGDYEGAFNKNIQEDEMPAHSHFTFKDEQGVLANRDLRLPFAVQEVRYYGSSNYTIESTASNPPDIYSTSDAGGQQPFNILNPVVAVGYIIKALPDDIEQVRYTVGPGISALNGLSAQDNIINLETTEIGIKVDPEDFTFDGSGRLQVSDNWKDVNIDQGRPIQYVNNHSDRVQRYSNYPSDSDLHITPLDTGITLKDVNSKVFITAMISSEASYSGNGVWRLFRKVGSIETEIGSNKDTGGSNRRGITSGMHDDDNESTPGNVYIQYMDTPGSVNVEYIFKWAGKGVRFTLNGSVGTSTSQTWEQVSSNVNLVEIGG